jgi:hypothetical protein
MRGDVFGDDNRILENIGTDGHAMGKGGYTIADELRSDLVCLLAREVIQHFVEDAGLNDAIREISASREEAVISIELDDGSWERMRCRAMTKFVVEQLEGSNLTKNI